MDKSKRVYLLSILVLLILAAACQVETPILPDPTATMTEIITATSTDTPSATPSSTPTVTPTATPSPLPTVSEGELQGSISTLLSELDFVERVSSVQFLERKYFRKG